MPKIIYNTADNHLKLIRLFDRHGYRVTHHDAGMVQLTKVLAYIDSRNDLHRETRAVIPEKLRNNN